MRRTMLVLPLLLIATALAQDAFARGGGGHGGNVSVRGYTRSDGTYVAPHMRSAPDGNFSNNWSTRGNTNPYTGKEGTRDAPPPPSHGTAVSRPHADTSDNQ